MSQSYTFAMFTQATLLTELTIEADSLDEARKQFVAMDKRHLPWEVADPSALIRKATVERIVDEDGDTVFEDDWWSDDDGEWQMSGPNRLT